MRLLVVHQNAPAQYRHIIAHFAGKPGHEVVVLSQREERQIPGARWVVYPAPDLSNVRPHRYLGGVESAIHNAEAVMRAARDLKRQGFTPDIMLGHNAWGETLFLKDVWPDAPLMSYFEFFYDGYGGDVGFDPEFPSNPEEDGPRLRTRNAINLMGLEASDWGQSPTRWQRSRYPALHQQRITVFHDGIDTSDLRPNPNRIVSFAADGPNLAVGDEIITYVSRNLEPYRGFHTFMRALPEILRRRPKAKALLLGGEGVSYGAAPKDGRTYRQILTEEVGDRLDMSRVHFMGALPYEHYKAILQVSAVHVYFTVPFVLSWSMLEAMASGCLVIGSKTPPVEEVITDGDNGLLADFFNPAELADRVDQVLDHPDRMADVRRRARETIIERYDLATVCLPRFLKTIDDLVEGRRPVLDPADTAPPPPPPQAVAASGAVTVDQAMALAAKASQSGDFAEAQRLYGALIQQKPDHAEPFYQLALVLYRQRRLRPAAGLIRWAIALNPGIAHYHADLGVMVNGLRLKGERYRCYRRALTLDDKNYAIHMNMAAALFDLGKIEESEAAALHAQKLRPNHFGVLSNLANAQFKLGKMDSALANFRQALAINPESPEVRKNLGMVTMMKGRLKEGAAYYESRFESEDGKGEGRAYSQPRWKGERLNGETVFLHVEQGIGDTLNFCRYAPLIKARGAGRVIIEAQEPLLPLLKSLKGCDELLPKEAPPPAFDLYCPMLSLMHVFGTTLETIPADVPYLFADPERVARWAEAVPDRGRLRVGLVWAGSPMHMNDHHRSMPLTALTPLTDVAGVDFYSLQVGAPRGQIAEAGWEGRVTDLGGHVRDFADTAAIMQHLDLLISVDTSVVHLAGALGRPCWVMTPFAPDWRWLLDREDTPWYPSLRLFRQGAEGTWPAVIARLAAELEKLARGETVAIPSGQRAAKRAGKRR